MKLFAYGCSYTYGSELADDFLTGKSVQETEAIKKMLKSSREFLNNYCKNEKKKDKWETLSKNRSYARFIADECNLEYINRAVVGSSNIEIFYNILKDIKNNLISKDDVIFVGLTSLPRYTWFDNQRLVTGHPTNDLWPTEKFKRQYLLNTSDNDYILQLATHIRAIFDLCKDYKFFYQTTHWPYTMTYSESSVSRELFEELKLIDENAVLPYHCLFFELPEPQNYVIYSHTYGHPFKEFHKLFGKKLGEAIREKI